MKISIPKAAWIAIGFAVAGVAGIGAPRAALAQAAKTPAAAASLAGTRLAFLDPEKILRTTKQGQTEMKSLEDARAGIKKDLEDKVKSIQSAEKDLADKRDKLSDKEKKDRELSIDQLKQGLEKSGQEAQKQMEAKRLQVFLLLEERIRGLVTEYAKRNGISAVMTYEPQRLVFMEPALDITDTVIAEYDAKYPVAAAPAAPPTPATKP